MLLIEEMEEAQATALSCPKCSADNSPQRKFCSKCGFPLWEPCFNCGHTCAAGEEFCGACGANIGQIADEKIEEVESVLDKAERLRDDCRFDEAIVLLSSVRKNKHPRLAEYADQAATLINQLAAERTQRRKKAEEAFLEAERLFADCDYEGASTVIENVPSSLKNERIEELRGRIDQRRDELVSLTKDLQQAVKQKRLEDILPKIDRLLAIKPDHSQAKALADRVQKSLVVAAESELAAHRYDRAARLLDQIPENVLSPRAKEIAQRARELASLAWNLRNAPVLDRTLLALADRLGRLAPNDASLTKLFDSVRERVMLLEKQPRKPVSWARPPQTTPLGVPVEWLADFRRINCVDSPNIADMKQHPGRFAIACGLGLAGLGQTSLKIDLLALSQLGVMDRMNKFLRPKSVRTAWGIDVGTSGLKAVKMSWSASKKQATVEDAMLVEHAKPLNHAANEIEENKLVVETLKAFLAKRQIKGDRVCAGMPGRMSLCRQFDIPSASTRRARKLVEYETRVQLNYPIDQLVWDYHLFGGDDSHKSNGDKSTGSEGVRAVLIAAKLHAVERFLEAYHQAGMSVEMLQPDFIALHNLLVHDCLPPTDGSSPGCSTAVGLDIGCYSTNIVVSSSDSFWFHGCGVAGDSFTRYLVKEFKLSMVQAEQLKRSVESAPSFSEVERGLSPLFDDMLRETQHLLSVYTNESPDRPFQQVLGLGGGFALNGLFRYLRCGR